MQKNYAFSIMFLAMLAGGLMPQAHELASLIRYFVMAMLFFAFLDVEFNPRSFQKSVFWILAANTAIAFLGYGVFASSNITLALAAFMTGIAPAAIARRRAWRRRPGALRRYLRTRTSPGPLPARRRPGRR